MTFGSVTFDRGYVATLSDDGWSCPESPATARILNNKRWEYGPWCGSPAVCALNDAAKLLNGKADILFSPQYDPDAVY
jgi:hypothetical protein